MSVTDSISIPRDGASDGLRERLIKAAIRVISRESHRSITTASIGAQALLGAHAVDRAFPGGERECLTAACNRLIEGALQITECATGGEADAASRAHSALLALTAWMDAHKARARFIMDLLDADLALREETVERFSELLSQMADLPANQARRLTVECYQSLHQQVSRRKPTSDVVPEMLYRILTKLETPIEFPGH
ncbi:MAG: hypothetical protein ACRDK2_02410 [Solirubrobacteraceae bacterium]